MSLLSRFKKDYVNYLISIIIPALINAVSIPLFKRTLGAEAYGNFAIAFNSMLLLAALLTSWIMQSVIRYSASFADRGFLIQKSLYFSFITQLLFFLPVVAAVFYFKNDWIMAVFFALVLVTVSFQYVICAVSQSLFLSGKTIYSELIRSVSYISIGLLLLTTTRIFYMYSLFTGLFISFFLSGVYLFVQSKKVLAADPPSVNTSGVPQQLFKSFLLYGGPISLWFVFSYSITLVDKYYMLHSLGANAQGNYQALFDLLSRSIMLLCSPVVISLFPLVTEAYQSNKTREIKKLLTRIIIIEFAALIAALIGYWWFGSDVLSFIVKIPNTTEYKLMGEIIIAGTFFWQMGIVIHKYHEMKFKNGQLLVMIAIASFSQLGFYWLFSKSSNPMLYPAGYALAALIYLVLVSSGVLRSFLYLSKEEQPGL